MGRLAKIGLASAAAVSACAVGRARMLHAGATATERAMPLVGDALLPRADVVATRAITIAAPVEAVWPWIAQIGQGRGGFYSYDALENLFGCAIHSATEIVPDLQHPEAGDEIRLHPEVQLGVVVVQPPHVLVVRSPVGGPYEFTWAFVLRATANGGSRLVVRERYRYSSCGAALLVEPVAAASAVMTRKMLRGIRDRAVGARLGPTPVSGPGLYLYWIPLGAGTPVVRASGRVYEALVAVAHRRRPVALYHAALVADTGEERYVIEVAPEVDADGVATRGVVAGGAVGSALLSESRLFRYEVRRWRDGTILDLDAAVASPVVLTHDVATTGAGLDDLERVPCPVWGRDELHTGEMWNSNSVVAWLVTRAGLIDTAGAPPFGGRAPGWDAGVRVAEHAVHRVPETTRTLDMAV